MIDALEFIDYLEKKGVNFFVGVPDSLLKDFTSCVSETLDVSKYLITANEGNAIAVASGYSLGTGEIPAVFMQNSGLGNCINPLTSLTNKEVYSIPMILLIGWRGDPDQKDEPQHILPGQILKRQLDLLNIPNFVIDSSTNFYDIINNAIDKTNSIQAPVALIFKKNSFKKYLPKNSKSHQSIITRKQAIKKILSSLKENDVVLSTTGKASRELYEIREDTNIKRKDFMVIGSMGHVSSIALGLDLGIKKNSKNIICIDGDGSCLMHMGALAILGCSGTTNIKYFLLNNGVHDSVGGQATVGFKINFCDIAKACNFGSAFRCENFEELVSVMKSQEYNNSSCFVEVVIGVGESSDLKRPKETPIQNKNTFIQFIRGNS